MNQTNKFVVRAGLTVLLTLAAGLLLGLRTQEAKQTRPPAARATQKKAATRRPAPLQTHRNLGKAYYEQGQYAEAIGAFQKVIASGHALATDYPNLGLALIQANHLNDALGALTTAKQMDSGLVAADYSLGILYKRELRYPEAEAAFERVIAADSGDPAAWFNLGTVRFAQRKREEALDAYRHVVEVGFGRGQNFYVASLFRAFTVLSQLKRPDEAQKFLQLHEKMRSKVPDIALQSPALEAGKYGSVVVPPASAGPSIPKGGTEKAAFIDLTAKMGLAMVAATSARVPAASVQVGKGEYSLEFARAKLVPLFGSSVAIGDYDGDGFPDFYVANPAGPSHLFHNNGDGTFADVTETAGVAGAGLAATFADYDNSGKTSLFVAGPDGVRLYRNRGDGAFADETQKAGLSDRPASGGAARPGELDTGAMLFDADNDGLLDLVVTAYTNLASPPPKDSFVFPDDFPGAAVRFYRNNGDSTFTEMTRAAGLASAAGRARKVLFADFNNDGYMDLVIVRDDAPPLLYINQGEGKFADRTAKAGRELTQSVALDAQVADFNHDGNFDLVLWSSAGYQVLLGHGDGRFVAATPLPHITPPIEPFAFRGMMADLNGDGFEDLLGVDASGQLHFLANRANGFEEIALRLSCCGEDRLAGLAAWLGRPGSLDLLGVTRGGRLAAFEKDGPPGRWLEVKLSGSKSNTQGVGAIVEFKAGNYYSKILASGGPIRVFAGDLPRLDVLRVTWPTLIVQNMIAVNTNQRVEVRESERLASSCPLLYIWDGKQFVYWTDVLGMAPVGALAPDGTRLQPNPEEFVRLPGNLPEQNGAFIFHFTDELREVEYFDQVRLLAVDHPATEEIYANEIFFSSPVAPSLHSVRQKRVPVAAVDDRGRDVLPLIRELDGRYPASFRQHRVLGVAESHALTLDLGGVPEATPVALWLTGWVFWADSNGARAVSTNPKIPMVSPYVQVRDDQGHWTTVIPDMGIPSATNRSIRVDLTGKFLSPDRHVRIVTTLCVYWDQIFFTLGDSAAPRAVELPLDSADLHYRGFSFPVSDPEHRKPDFFEYSRLLSEAPWNPLAGRYTRYGDVAELLGATDDRLVVLGSGDELTIRFDARQLPPLKPGEKRDFFLHLSGWAKDGEPNTAFSRTVEPLPFRSMFQAPAGEPAPPPRSVEYARYLRTYQTRPGYALIPPLALRVRPSGERGGGDAGRYGASRPRHSGRSVRVKPGS
ncbi:MAG: VCBS repeat-containing protein [Acidobacteria bacterium]|nr:VCBS repeat-containing protein [Acidobacteriota bacterium]